MPTRRAEAANSATQSPSCGGADRCLVFCFIFLSSQELRLPLGWSLGATPTPHSEGFRAYVRFYSDFQLTVRRFRVISRGSIVPALCRAILRRSAAAKTIETTTSPGARHAMKADWLDLRKK